MYAIFEAKGKQFRAETGAKLRVPLLEAEPGEKVTFDHVLLADAGDRVVVGQPSLEGAFVAAEVLGHGKDDKIVVYKMKRRKGYRRKQGHRQGFTEIRVLNIEVGSGRPRAPKKKAPKAEAAPAPEQKPAAAPKAPEAAAREKAPAAKAAVPEAAAILITDSARALAEEAGLDPSTVAGTGKDGRITKADVQKAIKQRDEG